MSILNPFSWFSRDTASAIPSVSVDALPSAQLRQPVRHGYFDGGKFADGYGTTTILDLDYWTLRARSSQLFETNLFARGILRRLVTSEIVTGLHLEATPNESLLGYGEDELAPWTESTEDRFSVWAKDPTLCDSTEQSSFGALQSLARLESLAAGDVLVTLTQSQITRTPRIRLISGAAVQTPWTSALDLGANRIEHGVELDPQGRHVAYWVRQRDMTFKRLPAWGEKSGRRLAWLVYGSDKRVDQVRGTPLLGIILQALADLDRYRDSELRKAFIQSCLAVFVERSPDAKLSSGAIGNTVGGAVRADALSKTATSTAPRDYLAADLIPGIVVDTLSPGETVKFTNASQSVQGYGEFEAALVQGMAWALEIPPEVLTLSFNKAFSASKAAENNFNVYLSKARLSFAEQFCQPVYQDWLLSEVLNGHIDAPRFLDAWRDPRLYLTLGAWTSADWAGQAKLTVDPTKQMAAYDAALAAGTITRDRVARETSGMKFSRAVRQLRRENEMLRHALEPLTRIDPKVLAAAQKTGLRLVEEPEELDESDLEDVGAAE